MLNSFSFCMSEKNIHLPSFLKDIFTEYGILGDKFLYFSTLTCLSFFKFLSASKTFITVFFFFWGGRSFITTFLGVVFFLPPFLFSSSSSSCPSFFLLLFFFCVCLGFFELLGFVDLQLLLNWENYFFKPSPPFGGNTTYAYI